MPVSVRAVGTAVPPTVLPQSFARDLLARQPGISPLGRRRIAAAFDASAVDTRHTVLAELNPAAEASETAEFLTGPGLLRAPGTGVRNRLYVAHAPALLVAAAKQALAHAPGITPNDVSHVITVSCTGFFAPGPDYLLVRELGLRPTTARFHLGFMGCYAAFPALRLAQSLCEADPTAVVLVACVELCSLHLHLTDDPDTVVASSVFADGAGAAVITARPGNGTIAEFELDRLATGLVPDGATDMIWTIGDLGFDMVLNGAVPRLIERHVAAAVAPLFASAGLDLSDVAAWAVHPGGRSVLDRVQRALGLTDAQLAPSREVLRRFGNMSSATIWFILRALLAEPTTADRRVCAMAFGPGLTVESALLTQRPAARAAS